MIIALGEKKPKIGNHVFIAPTAVVVGDVTIGNGSSIWYGAVLRGDMAPIEIGEDSNIQDNCTVHTDYGKPTRIGSRVTIGHNAIIHACRIDDDCLIGMGTILLNETHVQTGTIVAAGSLLLEHQAVGPYHLVAGSPATVRKALPSYPVPKIADPVGNYRDAADEHMNMRILDAS